MSNCHKTVLFQSSPPDKIRPTYIRHYNPVLDKDDVVFVSKYYAEIVSASLSVDRKAIGKHHEGVFPNSNVLVFDHSSGLLAHFQVFL